MKTATARTKTPEGTRTITCWTPDGGAPRFVVEEMTNGRYRMIPGLEFDSYKAAATWAATDRELALLSKKMRWAEIDGAAVNLADLGRRWELQAKLKKMNRKAGAR